jgi:hypothetical protein
MYQHYVWCDAQYFNPNIALHKDAAAGLVGNIKRQGLPVTAAPDGKVAGVE